MQAIIGKVKNQLMDQFMNNINNRFGVVNDADYSIYQSNPVGLLWIDPVSWRACLASLEDV